MPELGDIRKGTEIGFKSSMKYIWHACLDCGKEQWIQLVHGAPASKRCKRCANRKSFSGKLNNQWKGGRLTRKDGYISILLPSDDFFNPMAGDRNYILEHRLVMAKHLKRCLLPWEVVHHKNGKRDDNRLENLQLLPDRRWHLVDLRVKQYIKRLENKIRRLQIQLKIEHPELKKRR